MPSGPGDQTLAPVDVQVDEAEAPGPSEVPSTFSPDEGVDGDGDERPPPDTDEPGITFEGIRRASKLLEERGEAPHGQLAARLEELNLPAERTDEVCVDPEGWRYRAWLGVISLLAMYSASVTAYEIAFTSHFSRFHPHFVFKWLLDVVFVANCALHFNVGYLLGGDKIMCRRTVRRRYLRSMQGAIDLLACLPLDIFQPATGFHPLWRCLKLLRLPLTLPYARHLRATAQRLEHARVLDVAQLVAFWLIFPHFCACGRLLVAQLDGYGADTWSPEAYQEALHPSEQYLHALFWATGLLTGYADGDIPVTVTQSLFTIALMNAGAFAFATTVGCMGTALPSSSKAGERFQVHVHCMKTWTARHSIPAELVADVTDYYAYQWKQIHRFSNAEEALAELPPSLRMEAIESMTAEALGRVPLFAKVEDGFFHALAQKMVNRRTSMGEDVTVQGEYHDAMAIVLRGQLKVVVDGDVVSTISSGSCIGEQGMLSRTVAAATVRTLTYCELWELSRQGFEDLRTEFVQTFEWLRQAAKLEKKNFERAKALRAAGTRPRRRMTVGLNWSERQQLSCDALEVAMEDSAVRGAATRPRAARTFKDAGLLVLRGAALKVTMLASGRGSRASASEARRSPLSRVEMKSRTEKVLSTAQERDADGRVGRSWVLLPDSLAASLVALLTHLALWYECVSLPFLVVFMGDQLWGSTVALAVVCDLVLLLDLLLGFRRVWTVDGMLVLSVESIGARYVASTFWPTLVASLPLSLLLPFHLLGADARALHAPRVLRAVRLINALSRDRISSQQPSSLEQLLQVARSSAFDLQYATRLLVPLLLLYLCVVHYVACGYWMVVRLQIPPTDEDEASWALLDRNATDHLFSEWMPTRQLLEYGTMVQWYCRALYFAVTNLTGLGKDLRPLEEAPLVFTLATWISGVLVFAYLTSSIVTVVMKRNVAGLSYRESVANTLDFMQGAKVDPAVVRRAKKWLERRWHAHGGASINVVLDELSPHCRQQLVGHVFGEIATSMPLFAPLTSADLETHERESERLSGERRARSQPGLFKLATTMQFKLASMPEVTAYLAAHAGFEVYDDGAWVVKRGMLNDRLYIIALGRAAVHLGGSDDKVVASLERGGLFGERSALLSTGIGRCDASVRAVGALELCTFTRKVVQVAMRMSGGAISRRLEALAAERELENAYFRTGKFTFQTCAQHIRAQVANRAGRAEPKAWDATGAGAASAAPGGLGPMEC